MERQPKPTPYASDALFADGRAKRATGGISPRSSAP